MATVTKDVTLKWGILFSGSPNIEFWYPADVPSDYARIYHGISNNVPSRKIIKTIRMGVSSGGVRNVRNIGYDDELIKLDIVLATKEEANSFTDFFTNSIKGSSNIFYYKNHFTRQESIVRSMSNDLTMGENEGHPYSFSLLLKKEDPYVGKSSTFKWSIIDRSIVTFSAGSIHSAAITADGRLFTAGDNSVGQIGQSNTLNFSQIGTATNWVAVVCGQFHTIALNSDGELYGTGFNWTGELGLGHYNQVNVFTKIGVDTDWVDIACGGDQNTGFGHTLVLKSNGDLYSTGDNGYGQLGLGDWSGRNVFTFSSSNVSKITANQSHSFYISTSGALYGFGQNTPFPVLGVGDYTSRNTPVQVGTNTDWLDISTGYSHSIGVRGTSGAGTLWVWGNDANGQLGLGGSAELSSPVQLGVATNWTSVECRGFNSSYGVLSGAHYVWGRGGSGELGLGNQFDYNTPQLLAGAWSGIWSGWNSAYAILGGSGYSTGRNSDGQLGLGDTTNRTSFTNIPNL